MVRSTRLAAILLTLVCAPPVTVMAAPLDVRIVPAAPRQGDVGMLFVSGGGTARDVEGSLGGRPLVFFPHGAEYAALAGLDLETKPGKVAWSVGAVDASGTARKVAGSVTVKAGGVPGAR